MRVKRIGTAFFAQSKSAPISSYDAEARTFLRIFAMTRMKPFMREPSMLARRKKPPARLCAFMATR